MHEIERIPPSTRSSVREKIFSILAEYALGGNHGPILVKRLFLMTADELTKAGIIERPEFLGGKGLVGGQKFIQLIEGQQPTLFPDYGMPSSIANLIRQTIWELFIQGVLAPAPKRSQTVDRSVPHHYEDFWLSFDSFFLTPYGVLLLVDTTKRIQVHDPDGYLANFWNANPPPDPEMMRYLSECVAVFRSNHLLACIILLGIASERLVETLAESIRKAPKTHQGDEWFNSKYKNKSISDRFQAVSRKLLAEYGQDLARENLKEALQGMVTLVFEEIRHARNDIAHSQGREFTWNEVNGFLHNFIQYFRYINKVIALVTKP